jgi:riboflavin synthase
VFTGIIESTGLIVAIEAAGTNKHITIQCSMTDELKIDQSISHNGVCLTIVKIEGNTYTVTAIAETLLKTNLKKWQVGQKINLERCMPANGRFDGHIVQGHVDTTANCINIKDEQGSWLFTFELSADSQTQLLVEKGSICINGISLTLVNVNNNQFSVAIIPYTYENTNMHQLTIGSIVNIEYDIIGKYISKMLAGKV